MIRVDFYHDAENKLAVAIRLAQKAYRSGLRVWVAPIDSEMAHQIDRLMWTFAPLSFLPHCQSRSPLAGQTPIVIGTSDVGNERHQGGVLINLTDSVPAATAGFDRIVEIVTRAHDDVEAARQRYRQYREQGCDLHAHRLESGT